MLLNLREYYRPGEGAPAGQQRDRLDAALSLLARTDTRTLALAGGDSLVGSSDPAVEAVVDLQGLGLDGIAREDGRLRVGAMATRAALAADAIAQDWYNGLLAEGAGHWGGNVQRNRATLGGALSTAAANDPLVVALAALGGEVVLYSRQGAATLPLDDFLASKAALLAAPALITDILVPAPGPHCGAAMTTVARTPADAPIVVAAAVVVRAGERCDSVRLALGGVALTPVLMTDATAQLAGQAWSAAGVASAAGQIRSRVAPAGDFRGSAEYRQAMAGVLSARALHEAWDQAG